MKALSNRLNSSDAYALIYCLLISGLVRLPFFFEDVLNWDESTFILTGQSLLDGHLPYTQLWDLKPPLLPFAFAIFISLFGKSIVSIRIAGAVCVAFSAWFTYLIGKKIKSPELGLVAATLTVGTLSALNFRHFATMSEHIALVPLLGAMLMLIQKPVTPRRLFWIGLLLSTATMVRLNLAYVALGIGLIAVLYLDQTYFSFKSFAQSVWVRGYSFALGGLTVVFLTVIPYVVTGQTTVWWRSVVQAPLSYSESTYSMRQAFDVHWSNFSDLVFDWTSIFFYNHVTATILFAGTIVGVFVVISVLVSKKLDSSELRWLVILITFVLTVGLSIANSGQGHLHYLLQIMPFLALIAAFAYAPLFESGRWKFSLPLGILAVALMLPHPKYEYMAMRVWDGESINHGPAFEIAEYFEGLDVEDQSIYMMTSHIAYWFLDKEPLTHSSTHPSNITKEYLLQYSSGPGATAETAMSEILEQEPDFIVTRSYISYLDGFDSARANLDSTLAQQYRLVEEFMGVQIYERVGS